MTDTNIIGVDNADAIVLSEKLNDLLANYEIHYQNLRGFHWNIKGESFFQLHAKFEELYTLAADRIDQIAERILTLEHIPMHSYSNYVKVSEIREATNITDGKECVGLILDDICVLLSKERELLQIAADSGDEGTIDLISGFVSANEKLTWMLSAYLKR